MGRIRLTLACWDYDRTRALQDGRVEVEVEGDAEAVLRFERTIRRGSPGSRVDDVSVHESPPSGRFHDFRILP